MQVKSRFKIGTTFYCYTVTPTPLFVPLNFEAVNETICSSNNPLDLRLYSLRSKEMKIFIIVTEKSKYIMKKKLSVARKDH